MNYISGLLANFDPAVAMMLVYVIALNVALTGVKKALDKVKDKTQNDWDNKISDAIGKVLGLLSKILEFASANSVILPPKAKAEIQNKDA